MNVTLSVPDEVMQEARSRAEALGTSVNQLVREYLEQFAGKGDLAHISSEFERLSYGSDGDSRSWKFNREDLYSRQ